MGAWAIAFFIVYGSIWNDVAEDFDICEAAFSAHHSPRDNKPMTECKIIEAKNNGK